MMRSPLGFPLREGIAVKNEGFFRQTDGGIERLHYAIVCTAFPVPGQFRKHVQEEMSDGTLRAIVPARGDVPGSPVYWYECETHYAQCMIPYMMYGARALLENEKYLRSAVEDGMIPELKVGDPWKTI